MLTRNQILKMASRKMKVGGQKYGKWDPKTDKRDLDNEIIEEYLDIINYALMQIQKLSL